MKFFMALLASASLAAASVQPWVVHNFTAEARVGTSERKNTSDQMSVMRVTFDLSIQKHHLYCEHLNYQSGAAGLFNVTNCTCHDDTILDKSKFETPLGMHFDFIMLGTPQLMPGAEDSPSRRRHYAAAKLTLKSREFESHTMIDARQLTPCESSDNLKPTPVPPSRSRVWRNQGRCNYSGPLSMQMTPVAKSPDKSKARSMPVHISRSDLLAARPSPGPKQPDGWSITNFKASHPARTMMSTISFNLHPGGKANVVSCKDESEAEEAGSLVNVTDAECAGADGWRFSFTEFEKPTRMNKKVGATDGKQQPILAGGMLVVCRGTQNDNCATYTFEELSFLHSQFGRDDVCPMCASVEFIGKKEFSLEMPHVPQDEQTGPEDGRGERYYY